MYGILRRTYGYCEWLPARVGGNADVRAGDDPAAMTPASSTCSSVTGAPPSATVTPADPRPTYSICYL